MERRRAGVRLRGCSHAVKLSLQPFDGLPFLTLTSSFSLQKAAPDAQRQPRPSTPNERHRATLKSTSMCTCTCTQRGETKGSLHGSDGGRLCMLRRCCNLLLIAALQNIHRNVKVQRSRLSAHFYFKC